jgi:putative ATP-dependent endonuclease of the OLD family
VGKVGNFQAENWAVFKRKKQKERVFAHTLYPTRQNVDDLHLLTNDSLKLRLRELAVPNAGIDLRSNVQLRHALWNAQPALDLAPKLVSLEEEDGKKIWEKLKAQLPIYALFQSDRPSKDEDAEVQDPMKLAVIQALQSVSDELEHIKTAVQEEATEVANRTIEKLREIDPKLAFDLLPHFKKDPKWDSLFPLTLTDESQIPVNKRGSGTRRLILISFFRAAAERKQSESELRSVMYAVEEPETSQHPSNQRLLVDALSDLADRPDCQVVLTTHVPSLAGLVPIEHLRYVHVVGGSSQVINNCDDAILSLISSELGILPDRRVQVLICVEGPTDVTFVRHLSRNLCRYDAALPDLSSDPRTAILPLGGSTLKQWVENQYLRNLGLPEIHIYDRDTDIPPKYQAAIDAVNARTDNSWATLTTKRELENYVHSDILHHVFGVNIEFADVDDVPKLLCAAINRDPSNPFAKLGESRAKKLIADRVAPLITIDHLQQLDAVDEVRSWFHQIGLRLR